MASDPFNLPFGEAVYFFRQKVSLPTESWTELWQGMHARAFTVAGAMKEDLLSDFRVAVDAAIADGETLEQFRSRFDSIVEKHGWSYKGGRDWRTRVIYETNLRTAYAAGRYQQMTDPDVIRMRPYWRYKHSDSVLHPRPMHLSWNGLVLKADDPWWHTHYPPNGWGCRCRAFSLSEREMKALGKDQPDTPPPVDMQQKTVGLYGTTPRTVSVLKGIDPGWGYNVGEAAWGKPLSKAVMGDWQAMKADAWERLTPGDWQSHGRPQHIQLDTPAASLGQRVDSASAMVPLIEAAIGGKEKAFNVPGGVTVLVDAEVLADHIDPARSPYIPFLPELLADPYEVWLSFEQHRGTGKVVMRSRIIKLVNTGEKEGLLLVVEARRGIMEAYTFVPNEVNYLQKQRQGMLLYGR